MSVGLSTHAGRPASPAVWIAGTVAAISVWFAIYWRLEALSTWLVSLLPVTPGSHIEEAARFFIFDAPKVLMLLTLVVFGMGVATWARGRAAGTASSGPEAGAASSDAGTYKAACGRDNGFCTRCLSPAERHLRRPAGMPHGED